MTAWQRSGQVNLVDLVIVTGGSRGIGAALLRQWPAEGPVRRMVVARGAPTEDVLPPQAGDHPDVVVERLDLADPATWEVLAQRLHEQLSDQRWDRIAFVHAAATLTPIGFVGDVDGAAYAIAAILDAAAPMAVGEAFMRALASTDHAGADVVLVQISSGAATKAMPGWSAYCAGKAAVDQWVRVVGAEATQRGTGVRVLAIAPGVVATAMQDEIRDASPADFPGVDRFIDLHATDQLADADEVARKLWALALDPATPTGSVLDIRNA